MKDIGPCFHLRLREVVSYDPDTGIFLWVPRLRSPFPGKPAGTTKTKKGYLRIAVDGRVYFAHNLAWIYMTAEQPRPYVDHKDGNGLNNSWSNLRLATHEQNIANRAIFKNNKSKVKGVSRSGRGFRAQIGFGGSKRYLGTFDTPEEAGAVYLREHIRLYGEFARLVNVNGAGGDV